ncbi:MAG: succinylglutamate desuccinylase/aspartoacylase family protein [Candidatus Bathyarchaeia archaeon]|jgi:predicted deacylase
MYGATKIRNIEAKAGEKTSGYLRVYESPNYVADMPLGIVNGYRAGPTLCLTGGTHGGLMYSAAEAIVRTYESMDPKKLSGVLLTVPYVDVPSHDFQSPHKSPIDGLSVSDCFPGNPNGTVSQVIAYTLLNEIIARSGFHVDLRSGNKDEMLIDYTVYCKTGNQLDNAKAYLANAYGTEVILLTTASDFVDDGQLIREASKHGVASIVASVGIGMDRRDEKDISAHLTGIENVMKYLRMLEGTPKRRLSKPQLELQPAYVVNSRNQGRFYSKVQIGGVVSTGELIGRIENSAGKTLEEICAPVDGIVHAISAKKAIYEGEKLVIIHRLFENWMNHYVKEWIDQFLED